MASRALGGQLFQPGRVVVRYYHCDLDGTDQPYSVWLPRDYTPKRKWPLVVQLHGLGGSYRMGNVRREIEDCVVVAPDGRGNTDYKLWGELDVIRVVEEARKHYNIDPDRVYLYGVSMGGSGSWQLGVHFPDVFAALGPICGNADHRVWERLWKWGETRTTWLSPKKAFIEATESPAFFAENLLNLPSYCIHGDRDNVVPCDHSRSMVAELEKSGCPVTYKECPGAGHGVPGGEFPPMLKWMKEQRRNPWPKRVVFTTAWRRHPGAYWVRVHRFERPFAFARIEAEVLGQSSVRVRTENLEEFSLHLVRPLVDPGKPVRVSINGRQDYRGPVPADGWLRLRRREGAWQPSRPPEGPHKTPELEGPIQHAFMSSFIIVFGTQGKDDRAKRVCREEARILADRWNRWARGRCRVKADREIKPAEIQNANLILVGDPAVNSLIPRVMPELPIRIEGNTIVFGDRRFEGDDLGLKLVYPNPLNPRRYVALFSGTTWRGVYQIVGRFGNWFDWGILDGWHWSDFAVLDDHTYSPETYLAVGFFDNDWRLNPQWTVLGDEKMRLARPPRRTPPLRRPAAGVGELYLSELEPAHARIEKGAVARDRSFNAHPLTLGGRTFKRGLGVHPNCDLAFDLHGLFPTFEAVVGSDLEGEEGVSEARDRAESFEFMVIGDGRMLYQTGRMRWDSPPRHIYIPIPRVRRLELKIHRRSGPRWLSGPVDWAIARVGEPIHNIVAVRPKVEGAERLVESRPLDGVWKLAGFPVGEGITHEAHRASAEARAGAIDVHVPGSVFAALDASGKGDAALRDAANQEWWHWREFDAPRGWEGRSVWLELDGAAYQSDCWLNGRWIGRTVGPFVSGRFEATKGVKLGEKNVVALRVTASPAEWAKGAGPFRPEPASKLVTSQELARHGYPPLGLWQPVRLKSAGPCLLRNLHVETVELRENGAKLRVEAEIESLVKERLSGRLTGSIEGGGLNRPPTAFAKEFNVDGHRTAGIELEVKLHHDPLRWSPRELGQQRLYHLKAELALAGGAISDEADIRFGIRNVELDTAAGVARLRINGQTLHIRGCVWLPADAFLRLDPARYERLLGRARQCGFNTLRVWGGGLVETDLFYDLCDRHGMLVLQELPLTSEGPGQSADDFLRNAAETIRRLRRHPSLIAWCVGGAVNPRAMPDPRLTSELIALCARLDPQRRLIADSPKTGLAQLWTTRADPERRRTYWRSAPLRYTPGISSPSMPGTLRAWLGRELAWPSAGEWPSGVSSSAAAAFGRSRSAREHILRAQTAQAGALQRVLERRRAAPVSEILWQLNEPLPSSSPALIDAAGVPKPAYYVVRRARDPLSIFADFGGEAPSSLGVGERLTGEVCVESTVGPLRGVTASAAVLDRSLRRLASWRSRFDAERGILARPLVLDWSPDASLAGDVCFLHLRLDDEAGRRLASNLYWFGIVASRDKPRPLRVAWLTSRPRGPLADEAFLAATGVEVKRPGDELFAPVKEGEEPPNPFDGYDVVVIDAATVFTDYVDDDLKAAAKAVEKGCGLLVEGVDENLLESSLAPLLPIGHPALLPTGMARRPVAVAPDHPALRRVSFASCPPLARRRALEVRRNAMALAQLDEMHPLLVESAHGRGRVLALTTRPGGWDDLRRFYAGILGYLARLPHRELGELVESARPAPLRALGRLGPAIVEATARQEGDAAAVVLTNPSAGLAFMVHLEAAPAEVKGRAEPSAPIVFSDNYVWLLPGERRTIRVEAERTAAGRGGEEAPLSLELVVRGWNVAPQRLKGRLVVSGGRVSLRRR